MIKTTRAQRVALKRVYDRTPLYRAPSVFGSPAFMAIYDEPNCTPVSYREFRAGIHPSYDCIMLRWCGMWLGIEPDGYTHT